jgi:Dienelactone hydrolase and related enzymes
MGEWIERGLAFKDYPAGDKKFPGLILLMEAYGVNDHFRRLAGRLAGWGYAVLVPDLYRRFPEERRVVAYSDRETAMANLSRLKDEESKEDISRCLEILRSDPRVDKDRIGTVGFCMGGRLAFLSAGWFGEKIKAAVPFYGGGIGAPKGFFPGHTEVPLSLVPSIRADLLLLYGGKDDFIPEEERKAVSAALSAAGRPFRMETFSEAGHGFFCEDRPSYHKESADRAETLLREFLDSHLNSISSRKG